jgi:hypothetical protein
MSSVSHPPIRRISALAVALCYIWLSAFGSFLHDCVRSSAPTAHTRAYSSEQTDTQVAQESHITAHADGTHSCPVCAWQAANVSTALPAFEVVPSFARQQRVVTTFPRYLKTVILFSSSRAPPLA